MSESPSEPERSARWRWPAAALVHPAWLAAMSLLVVNDHLFKPWGVAPLVTGKLSDLAGLFAAPVLLAWLIRARTPRSVAGVHMAIGVTFTLLQLWPDFALAWSRAAQRVGLTWRTWPDPTDLVALPMLWLSWRVFGSVTDRRPPRSALRPALGLAALLGCAATSPAPTRHLIRAEDALRDMAPLRGCMPEHHAAVERMLARARTLDAEARYTDAEAAAEAAVQLAKQARTKAGSEPRCRPAPDAERPPPP